MQVIYKKDNYITVSFQEKPLHIVFDWSRLAVNLEELKELHMKAYEFVLSKKVKTLIADTSKVKDVLYKECIEWFGNEQVPRLSKVGVKRIITVVPKTALSRITTKSWQGAVEGIELHNADSLEDAIKLII